MRALLSVANREGIAALARELRSLDVEMFATDGTREFLAGEGIDVRSVNDLTNGGPTLGGQVMHYTGSPNRYGIPAFYALHVWAWRTNPGGVFAPNR